MDDKILDKFRESLTVHQQQLSQLLSENQKKTDIYLGGASLTDVRAMISEIQDTLQKIYDGNFGECQVCHEDVETELLEMNCTASVCIDHLSGKQRRDLEQDLELAGKVQRQLLAGTVPTLPGIQIAVHSQPAQIVGGDYYDFFSYRNGSQGFAIADVMGKGLAASMLMSNLQATLRIIGPENPNPAKVARRLNQLFLHNLKLIRFITIFTGIIDPENYQIQYCNAGHHPPLLWKYMTREIKVLSPTGPAIGLAREPGFTSRSFALEKGDLLLLYTDGLPECRDIGGRELGEERMMNYLQQNHSADAEIFIAGLRDMVRSFAGNIQDDITLMALKRDS